MAYGDFETVVGDEVGIVRRNYSYGGFVVARFGTVTKINGHGHIFVQWNNGEKEMRFTRRGDAYKDSYGPHLCRATQLRAELAAEERRREQMRVARELEQKVKDGWGYRGTFHATETMISELEALVAKLKESVN